MQTKLLGYEPKQRTLKTEALPTIVKHKVFNIVNTNCKRSDGISSCKRI